MQTKAESHELLRLQYRIAELEAALADAQEDLRLTRAWAKLICRASHGRASDTVGLLPFTQRQAASCA